MRGLREIALNLTFLVLVLLMGCQGPAKTDNPVVGWIAKMLPDNTETRRQKLLDRLSSPDADLRREGVRMLGEGEAAGWEVTQKILSIMAGGDPDAVVRATAVQVLAKNNRGENLDEVFKSSAKDSSPLVRRETVGVVQKRHSEASMLILLDRLGNDDDAAVRGEAAGFLAAYRDQRVVRALVGSLNDEDFGVVYRARASLMELTGKDFGYDKQAWQEWLYAAGDPFSDTTANSR